jgi:peptide/nickel transport system permease protein
MRFARYLLRRLIQAAIVVAAVVVLNFVLLKSMPGDVVDVLAGEASAADIGYLEDLRSKFGLDRPFLEQLGNFLWRMARFDLGHSFRHNQPVIDLILDRLPATLLLMIAAMALAVGAGIALGVVAARNVGRPLDAAISILALLFYATPVFWIGLMMITLFTVTLQWLPSSGMMAVASGRTGLALLADILRHMIMPVSALALFYIAVYVRLMRASMLEVLQLDYVRTAQAKGLSRARAAQCGAAGGNPRRRAGGPSARRRDPGRNRVRLARHRPARVRGGVPARYQPAARHPVPERAARGARESRDRRRLWLARPAHHLSLNGGRGAASCAATGATGRPSSASR